jgi:uncharacterized damage-inducible protein DinB
VSTASDVNCLTKLVDHCLWANDAWIGFIAEHAPSDTFAITRMSHILLGERAWFQRIAGEQVDPAVWSPLGFDELRETHRRHRDQYRRLLQGDLERIVPYTRFSGERYQSQVGDILLHLVTHGAHHRGQLATHVSSRGLKPINTDYVQYCLTLGV